MMTMEKNIMKIKRKAKMMTVKTRVTRVMNQRFYKYLRMYYFTKKKDSR